MGNRYSLSILLFSSPSRLFSSSSMRRMIEKKEENLPKDGLIYMLKKKSLASYHH
jgi:hypothetical protein